MAARLRRNEVIASEVRSEHTRALARTILSPAQQTRLRLLQVYIDKVSLCSPRSFLPFVVWHYIKPFLIVFLTV